LSRLHDHILISYDDEPEQVWWCDGSEVGSALCERGGKVLNRFHCSEGCNYDLCSPCVQETQKELENSSSFSKKEPHGRETDALLGSSTPEGKPPRKRGLLDYVNLCGYYTKPLILCALFVLAYLVIFTWLKRRYLQPVAYVFPVRYRLISNFTLTVHDGTQGVDDFYATGTALDYYDYHTTLPKWSSRSTYDPLTSTNRGIFLMFGGIFTSSVGKYYSYSTINGSSSCINFPLQVPPRDLFTQGTVIATKHYYNGDPCYVWKASYNGSEVEQWVSVAHNRPVRQVSALNFPVGGVASMKGLLITDFVELREMNDIPPYIFDPPSSCLSS